jgi:hypothetical protein
VWQIRIIADAEKKVYHDKRPQEMNRSILGTDECV